MSGPAEIQRALSAGAYRSLKACSPSADDPLPMKVWRRHRWSIAGVALFLLLELIGIGGLITGGMPNH